MPSPDDQAEGLRERKKRERQRALRRAAIELTLEKGFSTVTIEDICERGGVSRRTFFNYFATKEEALLGRADTLFDGEGDPALAEFEAGGPTGTLLADLEHLLAAVVRSRVSRREEMRQYHEVLKQEPALMHTQMSRMGSSERLLCEMIRRRLDSAADSGSDVDLARRAEALAALAMMAIRATFMRLRREDGDPAPVIHELFDDLRAIFAEAP